MERIRGERKRRLWATAIVCMAAWATALSITLGAKAEGVAMSKGETTVAMIVIAITGLLATVSLLMVGMTGGVPERVPTGHEEDAP